jgi:dihydrofolate reductase
MGTLGVFNFITLNGFFKGANDDTSWHRHGAEESQYASDSMKSGEPVLLFGRVTYEKMASFWPTQEAIKSLPDVAKAMNNAEKIVFSKTLKKAGWQSTRVVSDLIGEIKKLKDSTDKNMTVLGSGSIITQLADHDLVDEYGIMVDPVALGEGTPIFNNLKRKLDLELVNSRAFKSGVVLLTYKPKR